MENNNQIQIVDNQLTVTDVEKLLELVTQHEELGKKIDAFKKELKDKMQASNISMLENQFIKAQFIEKKDTLKFDEGAFQLDHPDLYSEYVSPKKNSPSFRVDFKNGKLEA